MKDYWLIICMSNDILKLVYGFDTSRQAWLKLDKSFVFKLRVKMIQLKEESQILKKVNLGVNEYVSKIKALRVELEFDGCPITEEEKLMHVLEGLMKILVASLLLYLKKDAQ